MSCQVSTKLIDSDIQEQRCYEAEQCLGNKES